MAFISSLALTMAIVKFSKRKATFANVAFHKTTRLGGTAIIVSFLLAIFLNGNLVFDNLKWGIVISSLVILFFGIYDDFKNLSWKKQLAVQMIAALIMVYAGLTVDYIANPFGGAEFRLDQFQYPIPDLGRGQASNIQYPIFGSLFIIFWIVSFMNVVNWLDGLDGLAGGVGAIGAIILFILSVSDLVNQPPLGIISIALAGAILGFLLFNFHPAKIFMGTSGSFFIGFMLAVLAIFSGGKIATALLIFGFPILDAVWVVAGRVKSGDSPFKGGDRRHLHYKLLKRGWSEKKVIMFIYAICALFGIMALVSQSLEKVLALMILFILFLGIIFGLGVSERFVNRKS